MYKFEAFVTFLRSGLRLAYVAVPSALIWLVIEAPVAKWSYVDYLCLMCAMKYQVFTVEMAQHVGLGILFSLGFSLLGALVTFFIWLFWVLRADLSFTRSSVATLSIACLFIGNGMTIASYLFIYGAIPAALGLALLVLETKRMRVLAATY